MADQPCEKCTFYDAILRSGKEGNHGRCAAKSTYPYAEESGQVFPPGVMRESPGVLAKPVIVVGREVVKGCDVFRAKTAATQVKKT